MAVARFCGRCGTALAPGATFCGRCGAPVGSVAITAPPAYTYPMAPPRPLGSQTTQIAVAAGLLLILIVATVAVSVFAIAQSNSSRQVCTANCKPIIVKPLPESATYRSGTYRFEVDYSSEWTVRTQDANGITLGTRYGLVTVTGLKAGVPPDQVIQGAVAALPSATWQDVTQVSDLKGAHIGDQNGLGAVYSANLIGANSTASKVRFAVITATRGGVTVVIMAVDPADPSGSPHGIPEAQMFDYMCSEFRWPS
jgi:hypothetical protein